MNRYQFLKKTYPIRLLFGGLRERELRFLILKTSLSLEEICSRMWSAGWGTAPFSTTFRGESWTLYKLVGDNQHQLHLRLYRVGDKIEIEGHYESDVQIFPHEHKDGVDLRPLSTWEIKSIKEVLE